MRFFFALVSFAAVALGQVTRDPNSSSSDGDYHGPRTSTVSSASKASASAEQWPQRVSTTAALSAGSSGNPFAFEDSSSAPFTFGDGVSGTPTGTDSWATWTGSATSTSSVWATSVKTSNPAAAVTSAAGITTHAPTFFSTTKASSSTSSTRASSAQATYTGAGSVGREVAFGFGAVAAGLALVL